MNKHNHIQAEQFPEVQSHTEAVSTIGASAVATAKITPPVTVSGFILAGHDMNDWVFVALVVDATGNIQQTFVPKNNSSGPVQETNFTTATNPGSLATRHLTDPATGAPNMFQICSVDDLTWVSAQSEVAEALVYNRALSTAEIMEQYELSKEFMFKVRGISI